MSSHRQERVVIQTPGHRITGALTLPVEGYRNRISDLLNAFERDFLALIDVTLEPVDGGKATQHDFLAVSRRHIVFAVPRDEDT
jgi:Family of unknown function (DUF6812)